MGGLLVGVLPLLGELQADEVVAAAGEQLPALVRADDVIGRAGEVFNGARFFQVVAQGPQGANFCHRVPFLSRSFSLFYGIWNPCVNRGTGKMAQNGPKRHPGVTLRSQKRAKIMKNHGAVRKNPCKVRNFAVLW